MTERERIEHQNRIDGLRHAIKCWRHRLARYRRELQKSEDKLSRAQAYGYRHKLAEAEQEIPMWIERIKNTDRYVRQWEADLAAIVSQDERPSTAPLTKDDEG